MDHRLLEIVACPSCKGKLKFDKEKNQLICTFDRLVFPIKEGIPVLLVSEAKVLPENESQ